MPASAATSATPSMQRFLDSIAMRAAVAIVNCFVLPVCLWFLADLSAQLKDLHTFMEAQRVSGAMMELRLSTIEKLAAERGALMGALKEDVNMLKYQVQQLHEGKRL